MNSRSSRNPQNPRSSQTNESHTFETFYVDTLNGIDFVNINGYTTFYTPQISDPSRYIEVFELTPFEKELILFERSPQFQRKF